MILKLESVPGSEMTAYLETSKAIVLQNEWLFFFSCQKAFACNLNLNSRSSHQ